VCGVGVAVGVGVVVGVYVGVASVAREVATPHVPHVEDVAHILVLDVLLGGFQVKADRDGVLV
jgi:ABC-type nitrate/sulfonate/bicarbonate transport system permease component